MISVNAETFTLETPIENGIVDNDTDIDPNQKFFVLGEFQDYLFMTSLVVCVLGSVLSATTAAVFFTKRNKQSKDIFACALSTVDVTCNLSGILFTLSQLSKWGYTKCACRVTIYFWRMTPTLSWLLILSIAVSRYLAVVKYDYFRRTFTKRKANSIIIFVIAVSAIVCLPFIKTCKEMVDEDYSKLNGASRPLIGDYTYSATVHASNWEMYAAVYRIVLVSVVSTLLLILYGRVVFELQKRKSQSRKLYKQLSSSTFGDEPKQDDETTHEDLDEMRSELDILTWFFTGARNFLKNNLNIAFEFSEDSDAQTEKMFIFISIVFGLTNMPFSIVETINNFSQNPNPNPRGESSLLVLFVLGFNLNPFLFYYANVWFRETMNNAVCAVFTKKRTYAY